MKKTMIAVMAGMMMITTVPVNTFHAAAASADEYYYNTKEGATRSKTASSLIGDMIKTDDNIRKLIKGTEAAVIIAAARLPFIQSVAEPFIQTMLALYNDETPEPSLEKISNRLGEISTDIDNAKQALIEAMNESNDMADFAKVVNAFNESYREMMKQIAHISGWEEFTREEKEAELAKLIETREAWTKTDNIVSKLTALGNYLCGETKLSSSNKDIYSTVMNYHSKSVCFGKEAMDKTDRFISDAMALYLEGTTQLINCILAERSCLIRQDTRNSLCDAAYCKTKTEDILKQVQSVTTALEKYKTANSPVTFYYHHGGSQTNIEMDELVDGVGFNGKETLETALSGKKTLSKEQMEYIVSYAKQNHPEKTLHEFLIYVGFNFSGTTYKRWAEQCSEMQADYRIIYYNTKGLTEEQKRMLEYCIDPTEDNFAKYCRMCGTDANLMVDSGSSNAVTMSSGCSIRYYYHGVKLQDKAKSVQSFDYLRISKGWGTSKTNLASADMLFLVRK